MKNEKLIKKYYKYIKPYLKQYVLLILLSIFLSICTLPVPLMISSIIDNCIMNKNLDTITNAGLIIVAIYVLKSCFQYFVNKRFSVIGNDICIAIRNDVMYHIQNIPISYVEQEGTGKLVSLMMNDISIASNLLTANMVSELISNCFIMIIILIELFWISWKLTMSLLMVVPFYYFIFRKFNSKVRTISKETQRQSANVVSLLTDILTNQKIIRAYNSESIFGRKFQESLKKLASLHNCANAITYVVQQLTYFFVSLGPIAVIWFGIYLVLNNEMSLGILIAFYQYVMQIFSPFNIFMSFNVQFQTANGALSRIDELLNIPKDTNTENVINCSKLQGNIVFKNVSFSYAEKSVLHNLNLQIQRGEYVAIVGPSGSGKTTITNLLLGFYAPDKGEILFDEVRNSEYEKSFIRSQIGIVTQEPYLFNSSIRENILLSKPNASEQEMIEAAKKARIHDYIISLDKGYDSSVNERGNNLSGGQKQRISLARVFLQEPSIVIFDEATSALDSHLESMINETLYRLSGKSTCIVISHRIAAISGADKIFVIKDGEMIECGNHEELLRNKNIYYDLYNKQFNGQVQ